MRIEFDSAEQATRCLSGNNYVQAEIYEERDLAIARRVLKTPLHSIWLRDGVIGVEAHVGIDGTVVITFSVPIGDSAEEVAMILSKEGFCKLQDLEQPLHSVWSDGENSVTLDTDGWCDFDEMVADLDDVRWADCTEILNLIHTRRDRDRWGLRALNPTPPCTQ